MSLRWTCRYDGFCIALPVCTLVAGPGPTVSSVLGTSCGDVPFCSAGRTTGRSRYALHICHSPRRSPLWRRPCAGSSAGSDGRRRPRLARCSTIHHLSCSQTRRFCTMDRPTPCGQKDRLSRYARRTPAALGFHGTRKAFLVRALYRACIHDATSRTHGGSSTSSFSRGARHAEEHVGSLQDAGRSRTGGVSDTARSGQKKKTWVRVLGSRAAVRAAVCAERGEGGGQGTGSSRVFQGLVRERQI